MNKVVEASAEISVLSENSNLEFKTPPQNEKQQLKDENSQNAANELRKPTTPDLLKVPKAFKYPERYKSPTDLMMSPITRGLLARSRRGGGAVLPPSLKEQNKVSQDLGLFP